ncbi:MAG: adenosine deaminase [Deltaproteobacteria bacterium]|nr:adenosine deaminase [Deltaproteobacteria bacterium]
MHCELMLKKQGDKMKKKSSQAGSSSSKEKKGVSAVKKRDATSTNVTRELLHRLPKTDLHCHLDGSLRLSSILEMAEQQQVELPASDEDSLAKALHKGEICKDLVEYLKAFDITCSVLQTEVALERAAYELAEDAAEENVWHLEVRYAPILHTRRGLPLGRIVEAVLRGLETAARDFGLTFGVILCGIRNIDPSISYRLAELAIAYRPRGVVAFDLAGGEKGGPAKAHKDSFRLVLDNDMSCTVHAGEAYGPESIKQALHYCGAHRIGHGTRLAEDGGLLGYVTDHRVPLEVCLSSNLQTSVVKDLSEHPLRLFYDVGVRVSLNTDNRLITDTTVTDELFLAHQHLGFTLEDLKVLIVQGFKSSFLPYRVKRDLLRRVNDELAEATGRLPRGAVLAREVDVDSLPAEFEPILGLAGATDDTDRL